MPAFSYFDAPGYAEAVERERRLRTEAFVRYRERICGFDVLPMSIRHFLLLEGSESPFVVGGTPQPAHVPQFLWIVSPDYLSSYGGKIKKLRARARRRRIVRKSRQLDFVEACRDISGYVESAFWDSMGSEKQDREPFASWPAMVAHQLAKSYGVYPAGEGLDAILDTPLKLTWQYLRNIRKDHDPDAFIDNRSSVVVHDWLAAERGEIDGV